MHFNNNWNLNRSLIFDLYMFLFWYSKKKRIWLEFRWNFVSFIGDWQKIMYVFYVYFFFDILKEEDLLRVWMKFKQMLDLFHIYFLIS